MNFQGTKGWIESQLETGLCFLLQFVKNVCIFSLTGAFFCVVTENSVLNDVSFVLCLDSIGNGDGLYLHVSKPPKPESEGDRFLQVRTIPQNR